MLIVQILIQLQKINCFYFYDVGETPGKDLRHTIRETLV